MILKTEKLRDLSELVVLLLLITLITTLVGLICFNFLKILVLGDMDLYLRIPRILASVINDEIHLYTDTYLKLKQTAISEVARINRLGINWYVVAFFAIIFAMFRFIKAK